jgi:lysophospholipase L1-like esterase
MHPRISWLRVLLPLAAWAAYAAFAPIPASAQNAPLRIMALGDSITAGYTDNPNWTVPFSYGFRSGLYNRLTAANYSFQFVGGSQEPRNGAFGPVTNVSNAVANLPAVDQDYSRGYGGWGVDNITANVSNWLNSDNPDVVLLMIGINNIGQGQTAAPTAVETSLNGLVTTIVGQRPNARVIVAQITPYASDTAAIVHYNNYIKNTLVPAFTSQGKHVSTVDQYSNLLTTGGAIDQSLFANGVNHPNAAAYDKLAQTWFGGIQALGTLATSPLPAPSVLSNGGFETACFTADSHNINPAGGNWTFTPSSAGAGSGIDQGNPYGVSNSTPATGLQMGFLQGSGPGAGTTSIQQDMKCLIPGMTYSLSFKAKAIGAFSGANPFRVSVGGADLSFSGNTLVTPTASAYSQYTCTFTAAAATMPLRFYDAGNVETGKDSWIDDVKLSLVTPPSGNLVANGGFETPAFGGNVHVVNPPGSKWRFISTGSGGGIDRGNPYGSTVKNSVAEAGNQMAFLRGSGAGKGTTSIEQDVAALEVGVRYILSFQSCAIEGLAGVDPFSVSIGGIPITFDGGLTRISPSASYGLYCSDPFVATDATMTLRFYDDGNVPAGQVSWLDDVQIFKVPEPSGLAFLCLGGMALMGYNRRLRKHRLRASTKWKIFND